MGTNENSYGHALLQKSVTPSYENSVPRTHTPQKKLDLRPCLQEIKYVSHLLRSKLKNQDIAYSSATTINQDRYISTNFWGFVKRVIERVLLYCLPSPRTIALISISKCSLQFFLVRNLPYHTGSLLSTSLLLLSIHLLHLMEKLLKSFEE